MRTFALRSLVASSLGHCGTPVPITCDAALPHPLFTLGTVLGHGAVDYPRALVPSLAWLLACLCATRCCLGPRGAGLHSSITRSPLGLRLDGKDRLVPKIRFSGLRVRFRAKPFTSLLSFILPLAFAFSRYTTERLTRPYSGGPTRCRALPLDRQPLPGCPIPRLFRLARRPRRGRGVFRRRAASKECIASSTELQAPGRSLRSEVIPATRSDNRTNGLYNYQWNQSLATPP